MLYAISRAVNGQFSGGFLIGQRLVFHPSSTLNGTTVPYRRFGALRGSVSMSACQGAWGSGSLVLCLELWVMGYGLWLEMCKWGYGLKVCIYGWSLSLPELLYKKKFQIWAQSVYICTI